MTDNTETDRPAGPPEGERIAKVMARAGLCSRRDAERWIADGRVAVNGKVLESPAFNVTDEDRIVVDGRPLARRERTRLFLFHKPRGTVTTDHDPEGRPTIFDVLPPDLPRLVTIGRLDINTEGLLLLTNDGGLARVLELPATGWLRRYRVRAHGEIDQARLDALAEGVVIEGVEYRGIEAKLDRVQGSNVWLTMGLREGKNREIKRVLEHLGLSVNRLIRLSYGPFQLGELEDGAVEEIKTRILQDQLGVALAEEAGVDFEAPVFDRKDREKIARRHPNDEPRPTRGKRDAKGRGRDDSRPRDESRAERPAADPRTKRKHVSVLRAERDQSERRKIERSETADRSGRKIAVERVAPRQTDAEPDTRNARRFAKARGWRGDDAPPARRERTDGDRPPRRPRAEGDAPRRDSRGEGRPAGRFVKRAEGGRAGGFRRREDAPDRPSRQGREEGRERPARAPRGEGGGFRAERPPRREGERPPRREGGRAE
ncbi:MAG TPA: pseudouridine synthase, partial [Beijerinckiaceae bacterium]